MNGPVCKETFKRIGRPMAAPGGFELRALAALVHLREAWLTGDAGNAPVMLDAIAIVVGRCEHRGLAIAVLSDGLEAAGSKGTRALLLELVSRGVQLPEAQPGLFR